MDASIPMDAKIDIFYFFAGQLIPLFLPAQNNAVAVAINGDSPVSAPGDNKKCLPFEPAYAGICGEYGILSRLL